LIERDALMRRGNGKATALWIAIFSLAAGGWIEDFMASKR